MKYYVLTQCAAEENYTPQIFTNRNVARAELKRRYDELTSYKDYVDNSELYDDKAEIIYVDDTYDALEIFEVEIAE